MPQAIPLPTCPMAKVCRNMVKKRYSGIAMIIPGLLFVLLGIFVILEPRIIVWIVALGFLIVGTCMLMMSSIIRKIADQFREV